MDGCGEARFFDKDRFIIPLISAGKRVSLLSVLEENLRESPRIAARLCTLWHIERMVHSKRMRLQLLSGKEPIEPVIGSAKLPTKQTKQKSEQSLAIHSKLVHLSTHTINGADHHRHSPVMAAGRLLCDGSNYFVRAPSIRAYGVQLEITINKRAFARHIYRARSFGRTLFRFGIVLLAAGSIGNGSRRKRRVCLFYLIN